MLAREIAHSRGFQQFRLTHNDELDAALILAGNVGVPHDRRNCFQTFYVNEQFLEYAFMVPDQEPVHLMACPPIFHMVLGTQRAAVRAATEVSERVVGA
jgi:hypothetical protein